MSAPPAAHAGRGRRDDAGSAGAVGAGGMHSETRGSCFFSGGRNQVRNSDFKVQTRMSLSSLVFWGGGVGNVA